MLIVLLQATLPAALRVSAATVPASSPPSKRNTAICSKNKAGRSA